MVYSVKYFALHFHRRQVMFEKNMKFTILLDTYGSLLSDRKREILEYYYNDDYSLAEISELTGISRQGVRDSIKKSEEEIYALDDKLMLAKKNKIIASAAEELEKLLSNPSLDDMVKQKLNSIIDSLNEFKTLDNGVLNVR